MAVVGDGRALAAGKMERLVGVGQYLDAYRLGQRMRTGRSWRSLRVQHAIGHHDRAAHHE